jgi:hypothetical protein
MILHLRGLRLDTNSIMNFPKNSLFICGDKLPLGATVIAGIFGPRDSESRLLNV